MNYHCVVCEIEIVEIQPCAHTSKKPWLGMFNDGVVDRIAAGYGSLLDGNRHIIAICDKCLNEKTLKGVTPFVDNYMSPDIGFRPLDI